MVATILQPLLPPMYNRKQIIRKKRFCGLKFDNFISFP